MTIQDSAIQWLQDGERASAGILNRPLKEVVNILNPKFEEIKTEIESPARLISSTGFVVEETKLDPAVVDGKVVYFDSAAGKYKLAVSDGTKASKAIGIYNKIDKGNSVFEHRIITLGEARVPSSLQATVIGTFYYLSTTAGDLTTNASQGSVVGICVDTNKILVSNTIASKPDLRYSETVMTNGVTTYNLAYIPGRSMFFIEGILIPPRDITATNGTSVTIKNMVPKSGDILSVMIIQ